jgi:hypothetical protein
MATATSTSLNWTNGLHEAKVDSPSHPSQYNNTRPTNMTKMTNHPPLKTAMTFLYPKQNNITHSRNNQ